MSTEFIDKTSTFGQLIIDKMESDIKIDGIQNLEKHQNQIVLNGEIQKNNNKEQLAIEEILLSQPDENSININNNNNNNNNNSITNNNNNNNNNDSVNNINNDNNLPENSKLNKNIQEDDLKSVNNQNVNLIENLNSKKSSLIDENTNLNEKLPSSSLPSSSSSDFSLPLAACPLSTSKSPELPSTVTSVVTVVSKPDENTSQVVKDVIPSLSTSKETNNNAETCDKINNIDYDSIDINVAVVNNNVNNNSSTDNNNCSISKSNNIVNNSSTTNQSSSASSSSASAASQQEMIKNIVEISESDNKNQIDINEHHTNDNLHVDAINVDDNILNKNYINNKKESCQIENNCIEQSSTLIVSKSTSNNNNNNNNNSLDIINDETKKCDSSNDNLKNNQNIDKQIKINDTESIPENSNLHIVVPYNEETLNSKSTSILFTDDDHHNKHALNADEISCGSINSNSSNNQNNNDNNNCSKNAKNNVSISNNADINTSDNKKFCDTFVDGKIDDTNNTNNNNINHHLDNDEIVDISKNAHTVQNKETESIENDLLPHLRPIQNNLPKCYSGDDDHSSPFIQSTTTTAATISDDNNHNQNGLESTNDIVKTNGPIMNDNEYVRKEHSKTIDNIECTKPKFALSSLHTTIATTSTTISIETVENPLPKEKLFIQNSNNNNNNNSGNKEPTIAETAAISSSTSKFNYSLDLTQNNLTIPITSSKIYRSSTSSLYVNNPDFSKHQSTTSNQNQTYSTPPQQYPNSSKPLNALSPLHMKPPDFSKITSTQQQSSSPSSSNKPIKNSSSIKTTNSSNKSSSIQNYQPAEKIINSQNFAEISKKYNYISDLQLKNPNQQHIINTINEVASNTTSSSSSSSASASTNYSNSNNNNNSIHPSLYVKPPEFNNQQHNDYLSMSNHRSMSSTSSSHLPNGSIAGYSRSSSSNSNNSIQFDEPTAHIIHKSHYLNNKSNPSSISQLPPTTTTTPTTIANVKLTMASTIPISSPSIVTAPPQIVNKIIEPATNLYKSYPQISQDVTMSIVTTPQQPLAQQQPQHHQMMPQTSNNNRLHQDENYQPNHQSIKHLNEKIKTHEYYQSIQQSPQQQQQHQQQQSQQPQITSHNNYPHQHYDSQRVPDPYNYNNLHHHNKDVMHHQNAVKFTIEKSSTTDADDNYSKQNSSYLPRNENPSTYYETSSSKRPTAASLSHSSGPSHASGPLPPSQYQHDHHSNQHQQFIHSRTPENDNRGAYDNRQYEQQHYHLNPSTQESPTLPIHATTASTKSINHRSNLKSPIVGSNNNCTTNKGNESTINYADGMMNPPQNWPSSHNRILQSPHGSRTSSPSSLTPSPVNQHSRITQSTSSIGTNPSPIGPSQSPTTCLYVSPHPTPSPTSYNGCSSTGASAAATTAATPSPIPFKNSPSPVQYYPQQQQHSQLPLHQQNQQYYHQNHNDLLTNNNRYSQSSLQPPPPPPPAPPSQSTNSIKGGSNIPIPPNNIAKDSYYHNNSNDIPKNNNSIHHNSQSNNMKSLTAGYEEQQQQHGLRKSKSGTELDRYNHNNHNNNILNTKYQSQNNLRIQKSNNINNNQYHNDGGFPNNTNLTIKHSSSDLNIQKSSTSTVTTVERQPYHHHHHHYQTQKTIIDPYLYRQSSEADLNYEIIKKTLNKDISSTSSSSTSTSTSSQHVLSTNRRTDTDLSRSIFDTPTKLIITTTTTTTTAQTTTSIITTSKSKDYPYNPHPPHPPPPPPSHSHSHSQHQPISNHIDGTSSLNDQSTSSSSSFYQRGAYEMLPTNPIYPKENAIIEHHDMNYQKTGSSTSSLSASATTKEYQDFSIDPSLLQRPDLKIIKKSIPNDNKHLISNHRHDDNNNNNHHHHPQHQQHQQQHDQYSRNHPVNNNKNTPQSSIPISNSSYYNYGPSVTPTNEFNNKPDLSVTVSRVIGPSSLPSVTIQPQPNINEILSSNIVIKRPQQPQHSASSSSSSSGGISQNYQSASIIKVKNDLIIPQLNVSMQPQLPPLQQHQSSQQLTINNNPLGNVTINNANFKPTITSAAASSSSSSSSASSKSIFTPVKRESPLDLSVKTVKTKADSTGCDDYNSSSSPSSSTTPSRHRIDPSLPQQIIPNLPQQQRAMIIPERVQQQQQPIQMAPQRQHQHQYQPQPNQPLQHQLPLQPIIPHQQPIAQQQQPPPPMHQPQQQPAILQPPQPMPQQNQGYHNRLSSHSRQNTQNHQHYSMQNHSQSQQPQQQQQQSQSQNHPLKVDFSPNFNKRENRDYRYEPEIVQQPQQPQQLYTIPQQSQPLQRSSSDHLLQHAQQIQQQSHSYPMPQRNDALNNNIESPDNRYQQKQNVKQKNRNTDKSLPKQPKQPKQKSTSLPRSRDQQQQQQHQHQQQMTVAPPMIHTNSLPPPNNLMNSSITSPAPIVFGKTPEELKNFRTFENQNNIHNGNAQQPIVVHKQRSISNERIKISSHQQHLNNIITSVVEGSNQTIPQQHYDPHNHYEHKSKRDEYEKSMNAHGHYENHRKEHHNQTSFQRSSSLSTSMPTNNYQQRSMTTVDSNQYSEKLPYQYDDQSKNSQHQQQSRMMNEKQHYSYYDCNNDKNNAVALKPPPLNESAIYYNKKPSVIASKELLLQQQSSINTTPSPTPSSSSSSSSSRKRGYGEIYQQKSSSAVHNQGGTITPLTQERFYSSSTSMSSSSIPKQSRKDYHQQTGSNIVPISQHNKLIADDYGYTAPTTQSSSSSSSSSSSTTITAKSTFHQEVHDQRGTLPGTNSSYDSQYNNMKNSQMSTTRTISIGGNDEKHSSFNNHHDQFNSYNNTNNIEYNQQRQKQVSTIVENKQINLQKETLLNYGGNDRDKYNQNHNPNYSHWYPTHQQSSSQRQQPYQQQNESNDGRHHHQHQHQQQPQQPHHQQSNYDHRNSAYQPHYTVDGYKNDPNYLRMNQSQLAASPSSSSSSVSAAPYPLQPPVHHSNEYHNQHHSQPMDNSLPIIKSSITNDYRNNQKLYMNCPSPSSSAQSPSLGAAVTSGSTTTTIPATPSTILRGADQNVITKLRNNLEMKEIEKQKLLKHQSRSELKEQKQQSQSTIIEPLSQTGSSSGLLLPPPPPPPPLPLPLPFNTNKSVITQANNTTSICEEEGQQKSDIAQLLAARIRTKGELKGFTQILPPPLPLKNHSIPSASSSFDNGGSTSLSSSTSSLIDCKIKSDVNENDIIENKNDYPSSAINLDLMENQHQMAQSNQTGRFSMDLDWAGACNDFVEQLEMRGGDPLAGAGNISTGDGGTNNHSGAAAAASTSSSAANNLNYRKRRGRRKRKIALDDEALRMVVNVELPLEKLPGTVYNCDIDKRLVEIVKSENLLDKSAANTLKLNKSMASRNKFITSSSSDEDTPLHILKQQEQQKQQKQQQNDDNNIQNQHPLVEFNNETPQIDPGIDDNLKKEQIDTLKIMPKLVVKSHMPMNLHQSNTSQDKMSGPHQHHNHQPQQQQPQPQISPNKISKEKQREQREQHKRKRMLSMLTTSDDNSETEKNRQIDEKHRTKKVLRRKIRRRSQTNQIPQEKHQQESASLIIKTTTTTMLSTIPKQPITNPITNVDKSSCTDYENDEYNFKKSRKSSSPINSSDEIQSKLFHGAIELKTRDMSINQDNSKENIPNNKDLNCVISLENDNVQKNSKNIIYNTKFNGKLKENEAAGNDEDEFDENNDMEKSIAINKIINNKSMQINQNQDQENHQKSPESSSSSSSSPASSASSPSPRYAESKIEETMTRSKRKRELEKQISVNSKTLRNDKIIKASILTSIMNSSASAIVTTDTTTTTTNTTTTSLSISNISQQEKSIDNKPKTMDKIPSKLVKPCEVNIKPLTKSIGGNPSTTIATGKIDNDSKESTNAMEQLLKKKLSIVKQEKSEIKSSDDEIDINNPFGGGFSERLRSRKLKESEQSSMMDKTQIKDESVTSTPTTTDTSISLTSTPIKKNSTVDSKKKSIQKQSKKDDSIEDNDHADVDDVVHHELPPDWAKDVYEFKRSLKIPPNLITVVRPSFMNATFTTAAVAASAAAAAAAAAAAIVAAATAASAINNTVTETVQKQSNENQHVPVKRKRLLDPLNRGESTTTTTTATTEKDTKRLKYNKLKKNVLIMKLPTSGKGKITKKISTERLLIGGKKLKKSNSIDNSIIISQDESSLITSDTLQKSIIDVLHQRVSKNKQIKTISNCRRLALGMGIEVGHSTTANSSNSTDFGDAQFMMDDIHRKSSNSNAKDDDVPRKKHNVFETKILKSRTRTELRIMQKEASKREIFGGRGDDDDDFDNNNNINQNHDDDDDEDEGNDDGGAENITGNDDDKSLISASFSTTSSSTSTSTTTTIKLNEDHDDKNYSKKSIITYNQQYQKYLAKMNIIGGVTNNKTNANADVNEIETKTLLNVKDIKIENDNENDDKKLNNNAVKNSSNAAIANDDQKQSELSIKQEDDSLMPLPASLFLSKKKGRGNRGGRRKGSSGFDYIRKKKKPIPATKQFKKSTVGRPRTVRAITPRNRTAAINFLEDKDENDINREIRSWVLNKGVGESALHRAARLGYIDVIAYALERLNMDPDQKDNAGYTPLHEACSRGRVDIARILLEYGANHSETAHSGIRPLHEAVENGFVEIVRLLLSYGADPLLATYAGQTPLMMADDDDKVMLALLSNHLNDVQCTDMDKFKPWTFEGAWKLFDPYENGCDTFQNLPIDGLINEKNQLKLNETQSTTTTADTTIENVSDASVYSSSVLSPTLTQSSNNLSVQSLPPVVSSDSKTSTTTSAIAPKTTDCYEYVDEDDDIPTAVVDELPHKKFTKKNVSKNCSVLLKNIDRKEKKSIRHSIDNARNNNNNRIGGGAAGGSSKKNTALTSPPSSTIASTKDENDGTMNVPLSKLLLPPPPPPPPLPLSSSSQLFPPPALPPPPSSTALTSKIEIDPSCDEGSDGEIFEFEESDTPLMPLYSLRDENANDKWVLLSDLCYMLKVKSKDALLKQICPTNPTVSNNKDILRDLKMTDFLEKAICLQLLCTGEKLNIRSSKITLVKYNETVKKLLGVNTVIMRLT